MSKHTKGPWTYEQRNGERYIHAANGEALQCDAHYYPWVSANEADWHLIAAAPELLDACQEAADWLNIPFAPPAWIEMRRKLRAVISKATGG